MGPDRMLFKQETKIAPANFREEFEQFVDETIQWFKTRAMWNQLAYNFSRVTLVVVSAALPVFIANGRLTVPIFESVTLSGMAIYASIYVAIATGLETQFRPGEQWKHHRSIEIALKDMRREFHRQLELKAADPSAIKGDPFGSFYSTVTSLLKSESAQFWAFRITQWQADHKPPAPLNRSRRDIGISADHKPRPQTGSQDPAATDSLSPT
jgi:hypothetical protein